MASIGSKQYSGWFNSRKLADTLSRMQIPDSRAAIGEACRKIVAIGADGDRTAIISNVVNGNLADDSYDPCRRQFPEAQLRLIQANKMPAAWNDNKRLDWRIRHSLSFDRRL